MCASVLAPASYSSWPDLPRAGARRGVENGLRLLLQQPATFSPNGPSSKVQLTLGAGIEQQRYLQVAARAQYLYRDRFALLGYGEVNARLAKRQIAYNDPPSRQRQRRIDQHDPTRGGIELDPKHRLQHRERRTGCPSLGRAGRRIERGSAARPAPEPAIELGDATVRHVRRRPHQCIEDVMDAASVAVSGQTLRDKGVVMRPDRPIMIRHGIVARLTRSHGANAPT